MNYPLLAACTARFLPLIEGNLNGMAPDNMQPVSLYDPIRYFMALGGKRLRPLLAMAACEAYGGKGETALDVACGLEIFHNFSLIHDDIMDKAPTRRGKTTVHEKWDISTGILSGDLLLIEAYARFQNSPAGFREQLMERFTHTAREVCVGQAMDMEFEQDRIASAPEYLRMIEGKTAVLLGMSMYTGAILGGASAKAAEALYQFGIKAGIGFQIWDDWLDAFGLPEETGKQSGGDILAGKQTLLIIRLREQLKNEEQDIFNTAFSKRDLDSVMEFMHLHNISERVRTDIEDYRKQAIEALNQAELSEQSKQLFTEFLAFLLNRSY
jgi:geranylgeranyl diphosphate synthase, type II